MANFLQNFHRLGEIWGVVCIQILIHIHLSHRSDVCNIA